VNPTSVMGATKRVAELYVQSLNGSGVEFRVSGVGYRVSGNGKASPEPHLPKPEPRHPTPATRFVAVRFGNVLGSSGSVIPIFRKQIEAGGPVTVTHPEMKRYFMTIPEASQLVMQAGAIGQGGEIFVLDMGRPIKILDLAREMIRRSGLKLDEDIQIHITGIRPGEKLYEELSCDNEQTRPTAHPKISVWQLPTATAQEVKRKLDALASVIEGSPEEVIGALLECVPEYQPDSVNIPKKLESRSSVHQVAA